MSRILVLDDEPARHSLFAAVWVGHEIVQAWTSNEAIRALRETARFDIVTLDHDLGMASPGNGLHVARHIAEMQKRKRPGRVLVHTSNPVGAEAMLGTLRRAGIDTMRIDPLALARAASDHGPRCTVIGRCRGGGPTCEGHLAAAAPEE